VFSSQDKDSFTVNNERGDYIQIHDIINQGNQQIKSYTGQPSNKQ